MALGTTNFPGGLDSHVLGDPFGFSELVNGLVTQLTAALGVGDTTITVTSNIGLPERGIVVLGISLETSEVVTYTGLSGTTQLTGCTRGAGSTTARVHPAGALVVSAPVAAHLNDQAAAIVALEVQARTYGRDDFLADLVKILGDVAWIWLPAETDTTTSTDQGYSARTITHDATIAARLSDQGLGQRVSFNGSTQYATIPDAADLTFSSGGVDSGHSAGFLGNVTNVAAIKTLLSKYNTGQAERNWAINASGVMNVELYDQSGGGFIARSSNAAITMGADRLFGYSYTGSATTAGITEYDGGAVLASTAASGATYASMDNGTSAVEIGSLVNHSAFFLAGSCLLAFETRKVLSAADWWALKRLCNAYFNLSL